VNLEDTCGAKKAGRDCGLEKCMCEPLLGRVLRFCTQTIIQSAAAQLISDSGSFVQLLHAGWWTEGAARKPSKQSWQNAERICAAWAHACCSRGKSPEIGVIFSSQRHRTQWHWRAKGFSG